VQLLGRRFRAAASAGDGPVDLVAGPTTGGVILAFETGRQLGTRAIFAEEVHTGGHPRREFRRGFRIQPGERVLLVDDILTTGGSLLAMIPAVEAAGGEIIECVVLVDRSGGMRTLTSAQSGRRYPLARCGSSTCRPTSRARTRAAVRRGYGALRPGQRGRKARLTDPGALPSRLGLPPKPVRLLLGGLARDSRARCRSVITGLEPSGVCACTPTLPTQDLPPSPVVGVVVAIDQ
jgi:orotate phosphoribosyltransferase